MADVCNFQPLVLGLSSVMDTSDLELPSVHLHDRIHFYLHESVESLH